MKLLIADDEPLAILRLERLLQGRENIEVCARAKHGGEALALSATHSPDIVLLDIHMPVVDGLNCAREIGKAANPPAVIFTTAFDQHAIEAFDTHAIAYLLKPVNREKLFDALDRAETLNQAQLNALKEADPKLAQHREHLSSRNGDRVQLLPVSEVRFFQAEDKYVAAHTPQGKFLVDESLKQLEQEFESLFTRAHRNALVNRRFVTGIDGNRLALADIENGPQISRRHQANLRKLIKSL